MEQAVEKMKDYKITTPAFPKMPDIKVANGLSSLNLYMDSLDLYFDTLDTSLTKLSKDLSGMSKLIGINLNKGKDVNTGGWNGSIFDMLKL